MQKFGIDISTWQGGMNLARAKQEGVEFAMVRAGFTGSSDGVSKSVDNQFETFYKGCKANNIPIGAYWFSRATSYDRGKAEAEYMYNNCLKGKQFEYPIAIDVEDSKYQSKSGRTAITQAIKGFCEYLESKGYYVSIYANTNWFKNYMNLSELTKYDKWVAYWGSERPTNPENGMWQFGGDTNKIRSNKIAGMTCDQNYTYKDYPTIIKNAGLNGFSKQPTPEPSKPEPTPQPTKTIDELAQEVIDGKWGNGEDRYNRLTKAGYNYDKVQARVNEILKGKKVTTYTVQKGDNLSKIAKQFGTTWQKIYEDNKAVIGSNPNLIKVGQVLVIK